MADPGDTAALCNDTKSHIQYDQPGQPADLSTAGELEDGGGSVIGEEPLAATQSILNEGGEEGENGEEASGEAAEGDQAKAESKVPFIYLIVSMVTSRLIIYL